MSANETDVLIIGAGLIGCATAYYLSREGVECLVVDRGEINREGSGANAGSLHIQIRRTERVYSDETLRQFIPMKVAAGRIWAQIEQIDEGHDQAVREVDYLIKSHILRRTVPHPLPSTVQKDPNTVALFSFSQYGNICCFGTFADTLRNDLAKPRTDA